MPLPLRGAGAVVLICAALYGCANGPPYAEEMKSSPVAARAGGADSMESARLGFVGSALEPTTPPAEDEDAYDDAASASESSPGDGGDPDAAYAGARKRIYRGDFEILAPHPDDAVLRLVRESESRGGYLETREDQTVTVRVPAERFQEVVSLLTGFGRVLRESVSTQDVTAEWVDLGIRIQNAEASRARLLALLDKATDVKDILAIEQQLRRLTSEIEQMKGRLKLLDSQIAYSTLTVAFRGAAPPPRPRTGRSRFDWLNRVGVERVLSDF